MKKWILRIGLVAALAGAALLLREGRQLPPSPDETINRFFNAARDGDESTYLRLTSGRLRESLDQLRREQGGESFRANMERSLEGIMGQAVKKLPDAPVGMAAYEVELIFRDRNEVQTFLLEPIGSGWAIASIESARVYRPEIPYGTPVFAEPDDPPAEASGEPLPEP